VELFFTKRIASKCVFARMESFIANKLRVLLKSCVPLMAMACWVVSQAVGDGITLCIVHFVVSSTTCICFGFFALHSCLSLISVVVLASCSLVCPFTSLLALGAVLRKMKKENVCIELL